MHIAAKFLYNGRTIHTDGVRIKIDGDRISAVEDYRGNPEHTGYITPAFIDAHSHIGLARQAEPNAEEESNDGSNQIQPLLDPLNS